MKSGKLFISAFIIFFITSLTSAQSVKENFENGKKAFYADNFEEANKYFTLILEKESYDYEISYYKALVYEINFDNDRAISELTNAIGFKKKNSDAYFARAGIYDKQGKFEEAIDDYNNAIKYNKKFSDAYFNRASDLQELKLYDNAVIDYGKVIDLNPADDIAFYNRGLLYKELKQNDLAIEDFESAIRIDSIWEKELRPVIEQLKSGQ
ncbi:MAG: tetratricopeptide repeat protein [Bacteroidota bacterium]|nr:tetratricopeptide repeat protein [Bacteroidota bacterium]